MSKRNLGLKIIEVFQHEGQFSPELVPVVKAVATECRPSDPSTQAAVRFLSPMRGGDSEALERIPLGHNAVSAAEDFFADYAFGGVAGVDYQLGLVDYLLVVVGGVVGDYDYSVVGA